MDDAKEFPKQYPEQFVDVLKDMTFGDDFELKGSASQTSSLYYGDYDAFEKVHRNGELEDVLVGLRKDFQQMIIAEAEIDTGNDYAKKSLPESLAKEVEQKKKAILKSNGSANASGYHDKPSTKK